MATPDIKLTQLPLSQFSRYSIDPPPCFTHLLIQSSDPVLKTTHAIGDTVQFETYPAPCISLGTKQTGLATDIFLTHVGHVFGLIHYPYLEFLSSQVLIL